MLEKLRKLHQSLGGLNAEVIHIAGSKGKGTTAALLAKILELQEQKVGLFMSPAISGIEETVRVNDEPISTLVLQERLEEVRQVAGNAGVTLSAFEEETLAAILHFQKEGCKYVVLECGWGGRDDATNVVENKVLTLLTHVEIEHAEVLGNTLKDITLNKLGICRKGVPLLTLPTQYQEVLDTIVEADLEPGIAPAYDLGLHHPESAGLAILAADMLGFPMDSVIQEELVNMVVPGRFEIFSFGTHTIILEGAHTYDSIEWFLARLREYVIQHGLPDPKFAIHVLKDKDPELWKLFPLQKTVWVPIMDERAGSRPSELEEREVEEILKNLGAESEPQLLVFCGSFKLVAAVKKSKLKAAY